MLDEGVWQMKKIVFCIFCLIANICFGEPVSTDYCKNVYIGKIHRMSACYHQRYPIQSKDRIEFKELVVKIQQLIDKAWPKLDDAGKNEILLFAYALTHVKYNPGNMPEKTKVYEKRLAKLKAK